MRACLFTLLLVTAAAHAQTAIHGSLSGLVLDPTGSTVAAVKLTLRAADTGGEWNASTASDGAYQFPRLAPGAYSLLAEKEGFRRHEQHGLRISVNQNATVSIPLLVGEVASTLTVSADAAIVQSRDSSVSLLIDEARIKDLPLNSRDFQKLLFLAPGIGNQRSNNGASNNSTAGARDLANNYTVDGVTVNDERQTAGIAPGTSGHGGLRQPNAISTEAVQEFRVITTNADATFGRGSGAQVNVITKSGTNNWHGSAYEYLRNSALDARDFFNAGPFFDSQGRAKVPPFRQNLFGATLGGPIRKSRHFVFGNYEGFRQRLEQTTTFQLPNADLVRLVPGDLGRFFRAYYFDGNVIPQSGNPPGEIRPLAAADRTAALNAGFAPALFDANLANGEAASVLSVRNSRGDFDQDSFLVRTDHILNPFTNLSLRYAHANVARSSSAGNLPGTRSQSQFRFRSWSSQLTRTLGANQILELRAGILRGINQIVLADPISSLASLGVDPQSGIGFTFNGLGIRPPTVGPNPNWLDNQTTPQVSAMHTWTRGGLTLRSGIDLRAINVNFGNMGFRTPGYTYSGVVGPNGILGAAPGAADTLALTASATVFGLNGTPTTALRGWRSKQQEYFTQSDWRLTPRLTLNLGLRYSYFGVYSEVNGSFANLYATNGNDAVPGVNPFQVGRTANNLFPIAPGRGLYKPDRNNIQPRAGFAYALDRAARTVLRGAYGLYYDRVIQLGMSNMTNNAPFAFEGAVNNVPLRLGQAPPVNLRIPGVFGIDPSLRSPDTHRLNFTVERALGSDTVVSAAYVGLRARGLYRYVEPNAGSSFPQNLRPDQRFGWQRIYGNYSSSEYDSMQLVVRRRFARGFTFTAAYTRARQFDDASADAEFSSRATLINLGASPAAGIQGGTRFAERPISADFSHSELEAPHNFTGSFLWDLPFARRNRFAGGWQLAGVILLRNGATYNVTTGADYNDDGSFDDRPALAGGSLSAVRGSGLDKTQHLVPQSQAAALLSVPANVTNPFVVIPRNAFRGPAVHNYDISLIKNFGLTEQARLRLEINMFNLFNRTQLGLPNGTLSSAFFGRITSTVATTTPRQAQFGAKLTF
ncbi:MAG: carboxypeptidase regulatory-like domain-containing protein [Acidobacteria bacterium]|nr:carboxypeptidase regulatory-like domain-containing protein [Acidobacteriota bacterium]